MLDNIATAAQVTENFLQTRRESERYCEPLNLEDYGLQAMPETSPPKWHLAHTTWFFETFILKPFLPRYRPWHPQFERLFNSYYNGVGEPFPRPQRGLLSRPTLEDVMAYRRSVDDHMLALLNDTRHPERATILERAELGAHHEQQHQELLLSDLKYSFSVNPLSPVYVAPPQDASRAQPANLHWREFDGGLLDIGAQTDGFHYDNETPCHKSYVAPFALANRLVTNREYLAFIEDGGYRRPELWLADGWNSVRQQGWQSPLYWLDQDGERYEYTLHGLRPLELNEPVCHLSAYEADAFARWADARLPTEFEWESVARELPVAGQFVESHEYHPRPASGDESLTQVFGTLWEWTSSAYAPYPNFRPAAGAIGEYNGKFMCNQLVLRGGSCVSPQRHLRASYRNFFYPPDRWQFTGIRLAQSR